jgi:hypothetical protein
MVDQLLLQLEPFRPAHGADFLKEALADGVGKWRECLLVARQPAAGATDIWHADNVNGQRPSVNH